MALHDDPLALSDRAPAASRRVWLFDLDDTLHDATGASMRGINEAMTDYVARHLSLSHDEAAALRRRYWQRYGATLIGLVRHHGVRAAHFLEETHRLPDLESRLRVSPHDRAALRRLPGRKFVLTNAPRAYALRVLDALRLADVFDGVITVEDMRMFGHHRPKPDRRMFRHLMARLKVRPQDCVLVEDTLQHQRAARSLGMKTIWMQRYIRAAVHAPRAGVEVGIHACKKPTYVCARINRIQTLRALWCHSDERRP